MQNPKELLKEILISPGAGGGKQSSPSTKDSTRNKTKKTKKPLYPPIEAHWQLPPNDRPKSHRSFMATLSKSFKKRGSFGCPSMKLVLEGSHNPEDEKLVDSFREMLSLEGKLPHKHFDYHTLLRFLRMRDFDLTKAKDAFMQYVKWREEFGVDAISENLDFKEYQEVKKCYPHGYHGVDRYGRPVYIERVGMVDLEKFQKVTTVERFVRHHVYEQERTLNFRYPMCSLAAKRHIASTLSILDVKDVGMSQFSKPARHIFMEIQKIDSCYYPETLHRLFIINAGSGFKVLWKAIRAFLDVRTLSKIRVLGNDYRSSLLEAIEPSNLPSFLGGECSCCEFGGCLFSDKGPWNDAEINEMYWGMVCSEEEKKSVGSEENVRSDDVRDATLLRKIEAFEPVLDDAKEKIRRLGIAVKDTELVLQGLAQHIEELKRRI